MVEFSASQPLFIFCNYDKDPYFKRMNIAPHRDYLADNGNIKDSTRVLDYYIQGNEKEIIMLVKDILKKLCDISETEALNIYYEGT